MKGTDGYPREEAASEALAALACAERRLLVGVRHHSPACAAALPGLLDAFAPERLMVELPPEFTAWLPWLGHRDLVAPVALAGVRGEGSDLSFYPFADFSPELVAIRWASARGVPIEAIDQPVRARSREAKRDASPTKADAPGGAPRVVERMARHANARDSESLWDQLVETRALASDPEATRRAALLYGWASRLDAALGSGVPPRDLGRETHMRRCIEARAEERLAIVVGAFHAPALLDPPLLFASLDEGASDSDDEEVVTSLIPYSHDLLDSRSGYPAGIRDPRWQHHVWRALSGEAEMDAVVSRFVVEIGADIRSQGHVAGVPDTRETIRMTRDVARLRGLPAPGRRELLEAVETCMARGELLGRGRVLAASLERVLVGDTRGKLAPSTPRSGLLPHLLELFEALGLPGPASLGDEPKVLRLDPQRSWLDRRRHVALERLAVCGVPYGRPRTSSEASKVETLGEVWTLSWSPACEAMLELAGARGVTLKQAAAGALHAERRRLDLEGLLTGGARLELTVAAAAAGIPDLTTRGLRELTTTYIDEAQLSELMSASRLMTKIRSGHLPGLPIDEAPAGPGELVRFDWPADVDPRALLAAALDVAEGLVGSTRLDDAHSLLELVRILEADEATSDSSRLGWMLEQFAREGSPLMQGTAAALIAQLKPDRAAEFGDLLGSWIDGATSPDASRDLASRLRGSLAVAAALFEAHPAFTAALVDRIDSLDHGAFLRRLPALREGFEQLSPASRDRLLEVLLERHALVKNELTLEDDPHALSRQARADDRARSILELRWGSR